MKVLVAPLDWGLGHATRCVPVVREFLRCGAEVELAVVPANAAFFREVFPEVRQRIAPGYNIVYPKHGINMPLWLVKKSTHLNAVIRFEHRFAEEMVARHGYDIIVSDNRFGFYSTKAHSVYMTHQRRIAFPAAFSALESLGIRWHNSLMKHFDEVWIPDEERFQGYAGSLSHVEGSPVPVRFVGLLSRFADFDAECKSDGISENTNACDGRIGQNVFAIVSGVEPARTRFETALKEILAQIPGKHVMALGKPQKGLQVWTEGNIEFHNHMPTEEFARAVRNADWVISRGGYSTVMDMAYLGARCIFVPTPGQYEQVALAKELASSGYAIHVPAQELSLKALQKAFKTDVALPKPPHENALRSTVEDLVHRVSGEGPK